MRRLLHHKASLASLNLGTCSYPNDKDAARAICIGPIPPAKQSYPFIERQVRARAIPMQRPLRLSSGPRASSTSQSTPSPPATISTSTRGATVPTLWTTPWGAPLSTTQPVLSPSCARTTMGGPYQRPSTPPLAAPIPEPLSTSAWFESVLKAISTPQRALLPRSAVGLCQFWIGGTCVSF